MKYSLVIAEKPSVGMSIAKVLGATNRHEGYTEGNGFLVSWCYGHLVELVSAESYNDSFLKWRRADLPIVPKDWKYRVSRDKFKQFDVLRSLMRRNDVVEVINACDAGREGELIFRNVYKQADCTKPTKRLWISSMEDDAILRGFENLCPGSQYDNLYAAADCRAKADWLVGINATRLFSVLYHRTLNVGRVVSPTLALLVQREAEIEAFKPEPFYTVQLSFGGMEAASEKYDSKADADKLAADCEGNTVVCTKLEDVRKEEPAPALYDLTTLQREANKLLGYTAQQTLDYAQELYEKKLITYPRTDSRYLPEDMEDAVLKHMEAAASILGMEPDAVNLEELDISQVINGAKVTDHHAILPTVTSTKVDLASIPTGELDLLRLIARRVLVSISLPYIYTAYEAEFECGGVFKMKYKVPFSLGWKKYAGDENEETAPAVIFREGDVFAATDVAVKEGQTTSPAHYTEGALLHTMETAGAKETPKDAERKGLGTPATRAGIIEKLVATGFVERKKGKKSAVLCPTHVGASLITVLPEQLQSPLLTAEWESKLKQVEHGALDEATFLREIEDMMRELVKSYTVIQGAEVLFPSGREIVGKCPRCGSNVTESKKGFFCEKNECRFGLWRDNKFLTGKRIVLTKKMASALLTDGRVHVTGIHSEKSPRNYDADILLDDNGERTTYRLDFGKNRKK